MTTSPRTLIITRFPLSHDSKLFLSQTLPRYSRPLQRYHRREAPSKQIAAVLSKRNGPSGFSAASTAEEVTRGIDGSGLTAIVTGSTSGIGLETARVLALRGVNVVMAVRNVSSGNKLKEAMTTMNPSAKLDVMELDLISMASVRKFASEFNSSGRPLNVLINNAGVMGPPYQLSEDNIELQFATNYLGHFLLTNLLLDTLKKTARETKREGRIVNVASAFHRIAYKEGIRFDRLNDPKGYTRFGAYGQSKVTKILHSNELTRRLKGEGAEVTANSLHPGVVATNVLRHLGLLGAIAAQVKFLYKNVEQGASTSCYLALNPQVKGISGKYFSNNNIAEPLSMTQDAGMARKLWDFSMDLTK